MPHRWLRGVNPLGSSHRSHHSRRARPSLECLEGRALPSFLPPITSAAGANAYGVATADLTGNGILDLVTANWDSGLGSADTVSVFLGNGDGTFRPQHDYAAGPHPFALAVGDFNGDGIPDLAVVNNLTPNGTVSILLGNGDGSFQAPVAYAVGNGPVAVVAADFRGTGHLDLAVANWYSATMSVLLGNGDGTFQAKTDYAASVAVAALAVGDFNGDSIPDLVATDAQGGSHVNVFLGNGDGSFQPALASTLGGGTSVAAVDLNGNGRLDLALGNGPNVYVRFGNGDGTFQSPVSYHVGGFASSVAVADLRGDGIPDLVATTDAGNGQADAVCVLLGNGDGSFQAKVDYSVAHTPRMVVAADLTGDGTTDLVATGGAVDVYLGNGDGTFPPPSVLLVGGNPRAVAVGDVNGDGIPDVVTANVTGNDVGVLLGNGDGTFRPPVYYATDPTPYGPMGVTLQDLTGDGILDIVTTNYYGNTVSVLLGNGNGTFQPHVEYAAGNRPDGLTVADFNGDGVPDLAVTDYGNNQVSILLGNGDGTFQKPVSYATGYGPEGVAVADFNGDGIPDLAVANYAAFSNGAVSILLGNGDGTFQPALTFAANALSASVAVGDFNGDGIPDLAVASATGQGIGNGKVDVLLGNGDGTFQPAVKYDVGKEPQTVLTADVNGDGVLDLIAVNAGSNNISVLLGNGDGSFRLDAQYATGMDPQGAALGDFNGDGLPDVVTANGTGSVSVLLNAGDWPGRVPAVRVGPFAVPSSTGPTAIHEDPAGQPAPEKDAGANGRPVPDSNEQQAIPAIGGLPVPPGGRRLSVSVRGADPLAGRVAGNAILSTLWD